jgi:phage terminase large subunit-like protein
MKRSSRLIAWLEQLPVTKGHLAGQNMKLLPEQKKFIRAVYDNPQIKLAVLSAPRGSGKTGLSAGLCLAHLLGPEAIPRGETYSAAIDRGQAAILFGRCWRSPKRSTAWRRAFGSRGTLSGSRCWRARARAARTRR